MPSIEDKTTKNMLKLFEHVLQRIKKNTLIRWIAKITCISVI